MILYGIRRAILPCFVALAYLFLYFPIIVLIIFSLNNNAFAQDWNGFTLRWYGELFNSSEVWDALKNSLLVASVATLLSISMGALFVFFCARDYIQRFIFFFYVSLSMPEIVLAVAMLSFFSLLEIPLGLTTLIGGHTLLGLSYVVPILYTRLHEIDNRLVEAARDLGATQFQTFYTIIVPLLLPSLLASGLLVFIISLDDFIVSFFCMSASVQTLPLYIFSMIRAGATPVINALSTLLLLVSSLLVLLFSYLQAKKMGIIE